MQVLKEEVRSILTTAAVQVFYEKDFRSAKMQDIARLADVSAACFYSGASRTRKLFEASSRPFPSAFDRIAREEESVLADTPSEGSGSRPRDPLSTCGPSHTKRLVILVDKSRGTYLRACEGRFRREHRAAHPPHGKRAPLRYPDLSPVTCSQQLRGELDGGGSPLQQRRRGSRHAVLIAMLRRVNSL